MLCRAERREALQGTDRRVRGRGLTLHSTMRAALVVVKPPAIDHPPVLLHVQEQFPFEQFSRSLLLNDSNTNLKAGTVLGGGSDAVRAWRQRNREVCLPLSHQPGEAQVDFGFADVWLDGDQAKVASFVMTLPYSDVVYMQAFPRECTEAFLEGHLRAFAFFGGVPTRISYDNSKVAVAQIVGSRSSLIRSRYCPAIDESTWPMIALTAT